MNPETLQSAPRQEQELSSDKKFYDSLMHMASMRHPEQRRMMKKQLMREAPERHLEITLFSSFPEYIAIDKALNERKKMSQSELYRNFNFLTEQNFSLTMFGVYNRNDQEGMRLFWSSLRELAKRYDGGERTWAYMKSGILNQITLYTLLEKLGLDPKVSTPKDDAFKEKDLECYVPQEHKKFDIQAKTSSQFEALNVKQMDTIGYPNIATANKRVFPHALEQSPHYKASTKQSGRDIIGLRIEIPKTYYDQYTGMPTEQCEKEFNEKFNALK